ncbi:MAG TPA: tetratricopeptide repeat protein [Xanthobacteraceae bacterium]|nr:tetratricopeptide repeat protein [Xanthobacteraceae bacterium]
MIAAAAGAVCACSLNLDAVSGASTKESPAAAEASENALSEAIKADPKGPEPYLKRGLFYLSRERHEHAVADFSSALGLSARQPAALAGRAESYLALRKDWEAAADLDEAVRIEPDNRQAWILRGQAYERLGDLNRALGSYGQALHLNPADEEVLNNFKRLGGVEGRNYSPF